MKVGDKLNVASFAMPNQNGVLVPGSAIYDCPLSVLVCLDKVRSSVLAHNASEDCPSRRRMATPNGSNINLVRVRRAEG